MGWGEILSLVMSGMLHGRDASEQERLLRHHVRWRYPLLSLRFVRIFELYASGLGLKAIAKRLTSEGAAHPKPFRRKDGLTPVAGWSPATIRTILHRELYRGVVVWNKSRKRDDWGQVDQRERPTQEWARGEGEALRIVPEELWHRVRARCADTAGAPAR